MSDHEVYSRIFATVDKVLLVSPGHISPRTRLVDDLGADSMDILDIFFRLERQFGIEIPMPKQHAATVETIARYLQENTAAHLAPASSAVSEL